MKQVEERYISLLTDFGFDRLFEEAEIAKFTPQEMREYEFSKMAYRDIKNSVDTAKREGIAEGMEKGMGWSGQWLFRHQYGSDGGRRLRQRRLLLRTSDSALRASERRNDRTAAA
jgi:hypothetical protein